MHCIRKKHMCVIQGHLKGDIGLQEEGHQMRNPGHEKNETPGLDRLNPAPARRTQAARQMS